MSALTELIKRIGIFMIAAQAVIHFTPGQKYEKYIKLIVGMMVLSQFVVPLRSMVSGMETDWGAQMADMEKLLEAEGTVDEIAASTSVTESVINRLENEIKSKLNNEISGESYVVSNVRVYMKVSGEADAKETEFRGSSFDWQSATGTRQYELEKVRVVVYMRTGSEDGKVEKNMGNPIEKVQIEKIDVGGTADSGEAAFDPSPEGEMAEQLRKRFCSVLGKEEEKQEVSEYGANEKTNR